MSVVKRQVEGRDIWFIVERPLVSDPETGELAEAPGHYISFSTSEPPAPATGEIVKDAEGRGLIFPSEEGALEAGIREVKARMRLLAPLFAVGLVLRRGGAG